MKTFKLFIMLAVATFFAACSDSDSNTNPVQVGFEANEIVFNESDGLVKIPVKVTGESNGNISIVVKTTDNTAVSEEHYILTSNNLNIPTGAEVALELRLIDDGAEENADRDFTISIESANGATLADVNECRVVIKDVDAIPFFKLFGTYEVEAIDAKTGDPLSFLVTLDDEGEGTQEYLYGEGMPDSWYGFETKMMFGFHDNGALTFEVGYWDGLYNFGSFKGVVSWQPCNVVGGQLRPVESTDAAYNDTYDTITFAPGTYATTGVYEYDGGIQGYKGYYDDPIMLIKMTKVVE